MPPTLAAISERVEAAAAVKAVRRWCIGAHRRFYIARFLLCCASPGPMWMIGRGPRAMGRWRLLVGQQLQSGRRPELSEGYEGSSGEALEEFEVRSDGGFAATGPAGAEGDGDVWCAATVAAVAPAGMAGAANYRRARLRFFYMYLAGAAQVAVSLLALGTR